jgi:FixJ family two-component response regulator
VITDILMPEMLGTELSHNIKLLAPELKIIGMTGGGWSNNDMALDSNKMRDFDLLLKKPFNRSELLQAISSAIK